MESSTSDHSWWARGRCIGRGSFAAVQITTAKSTGRVVLVKSVDVSNYNQLIALENEIKLPRLLNPSPYVVQCLGDDMTSSPAGTIRNLHLEYLPYGIVSGGGEPELLVRSYTRCLVSALSHLHSLNIIHCDVKGRNVLVGHIPGQCKLADFGSAVDLPHSQTNAAIVPPRGSPLWMAPDVLRGEYQRPESDVWSLGCTVIEMLTGTHAWKDGGTDTIWRIAFSNETPELPASISEQGRAFLSRCLRREAAERWRCQQLLKDPFISSIELDTLSPCTPRCVLNGFDSKFNEYEERGSKSISTSEMKWWDSSLAMDKLCCDGREPVWEGDGWMSVRRTEYSDGVTDRGENEKTGEDGPSRCSSTLMTGCECRFQMLVTPGFVVGSGCGACLCGPNSTDVFGAVLCRLLSSIVLLLIISLFYYMYSTTLQRLFDYEFGFMQARF